MFQIKMDALSRTFFIKSYNGSVIGSGFNDKIEARNYAKQYFA